MPHDLYPGHDAFVYSPTRSKRSFIASFSLEPYRETPRIANRMLRRVWDFALVRADGKITQDVADTALTMLGIDRLGLDELDRKILGIIARDFDGGPVGAKTIAISAGEEVRTI